MSATAPGVNQSPSTKGFAINAHQIATERLFNLPDGPASLGQAVSKVTVPHGVVPISDDVEDVGSFARGRDALSSPVLIKLLLGGARLV